MSYIHHHPKPEKNNHPTSNLNLKPQKDVNPPTGRLALSPRIRMPQEVVELPALLVVNSVGLRCAMVTVLVGFGRGWGVVGGSWWTWKVAPPQKKQL